MVRTGLWNQGHAHVAGQRLEQTAALRLATASVREAADEPLDLVGDFVLPAASGEPTRDFQTLHIDFGVPLTPTPETTLALFTALYMPLSVPQSAAVTTLLYLPRLLSQRTWPAAEELLTRFEAYGVSHGARPGALGYVEGSLARIVEAADKEAELPSFKQEPSFLCGLEFTSADREMAFLEHHGVDVETGRRDVALGPGDLLIFDNRVIAHGRRGVRQPGELRQWAFGHQSASKPDQESFRAAFLKNFYRRDVPANRPAAQAST